MQYICKITVFVLFLTVFALSAQTPPNEEPVCDSKTGKRAQIGDGDATILGFTIGRASLKDVEAKLGRATPVRLTREEESDIFVCYVSPADGTVLAFYSGAMGGWTDVTHFALWSREAVPARYSHCVSSALVSRNLSTGGGLRVGLTRQEIENIAGRPANPAASSTKYEYICRLKMTAEEIQGFKAANNWDVSNDPYFDRMSWIAVGYANSVASHIEVGRTDSY